MSARGFRRGVGLCLLLLCLGFPLTAQDAEEGVAPPADQDPGVSEPAPSETESAEPEVDAEEPPTDGVVADSPATAEASATSGTLTEAQEGGPQAVPSVAAPDAVGAGGAFTHRVEIDMPAFRDLPLQVSLSYNSSDTFRGGVDNLIAFGWSLDGFSMIERKSIRGGVPTYDDGQDVYVLDGQELMACAGSGATNPWTLRYPLRYITDRTSASCSAGGNLVSRVEDFNRIVYSAENNTFTVTRPDGVKLTYTSVGTLAGDTSAAGTPERTYATKARWLLTRIEDTQATPNVVTYTYAFSGQSNGYAHRPSEIAYGGYRILLNYRSYPTAAVPKFATGTPIAGKQLYQLSSIRVYDGNTPIRAYRLDFGTPSALTQTQLLRKVQQYGSNFVYTAPDITGGTAMPAIEFEYSDDSVAFETRTYSGIEFHEASTVADTTRDGIDEVILGARTLYKSTPKPNGTGYNHQAYLLPAGRYSFTTARAPISLQALDADCTDVQEISPSSGGNEHVYARVRSATDVLPGYRSNANVYCMSRWKDFVVSGANGNYENQLDVLKSYLSDAVINSSPLGTLSWNMTSGNANWPKFLKGNFDLDPEMEIIANGKIYNMTNGQLDSGTTYTGGSGITSGTWLYNDFTGDGVDDILVGVPAEGMDSFSPGHYPPSRAYIRVRPEAGYVNGTSTPWASFTSLPISANTFIDPGLAIGWFVGFGDFDADGLTDVAYYDPNGSGADRLAVTRSTGAGFLEKTFYTLPSGVAYNFNFENSRSTVTDINADGLVDVILHEGFTEPETHDETLPRYTSQESFVLLNNGNGFTLLTATGSVPAFKSLIATGDFDGDGLVDIALEGVPVSSGSAMYTASSARVIFGNGGIPNRMVSVKNSAGGVTTVTYAPSSDFGVNEMPGVQQVVKSITTNDGRGGVHTITYGYSGGAYDFINRQTLGFETVTATLPAIAGETVGPKVVTTYLNGHIAEYGLVASRVVTQGSITLSREIFDYTVIKTGKGPYLATLSSERSATLYAATLVETRTDFILDAYGQKSQVTSMGFTTNGANIEGSDDVTATFTYQRNLVDYIVDRLAIYREEKGLVPLWSEADYISVSAYRYDDNSSHNLAPTIGNLRSVWVRTADPNNSSLTLTQAFDYDAYGNVLVEYDGKNVAVATHTYDTAKRLFRLTTTNAVGHIATTTWQLGCQLPLTVTDANDRVTTTQYDVLCRQTRIDLPGGQYKISRYVSFGNPVAQHVEFEEKSGSSVSGRTLRVSRIYFDGMGQSYVITTPGTATSITDSTLEIRAFDARGNLAWASIPLPWSSFGTVPTAAERTSFTYDGLDRPLVTTLADGAQLAKLYSVLTFGHFGAAAVSYPTVQHKDEHCFDAETSATVCGHAYVTQDARGNIIRTTLVDYDLSDTDAGSGTSRVTSFRYDLKNRLIAVVDPVSASWTYTYDGIGNRLTSSDPGLGAWTLTYDLNNNLLTQTDAKGQLIAFEYDALNRVTKKTVGTGAGRIETVFTYDQARTGYYNLGFETTQKVWLPATGAVAHEVERDYHLMGGLAVERHEVDGRTYTIETSFTGAGTILNQRLPYQPGGTATNWVGAFAYDAAGRLTGMTGHIDSIDYNLWSQPTLVTYSSGVIEEVLYNASRGWVSRIAGRKPGATSAFYGVQLTRTAAGRIARHDTWSGDPAGAYDFTYDYAGRLLTATNFRSVAAASEVYSYDKAGRLRSKGAPAAPAAYAYSPSTKPDHAPHTLTLDGVVTIFTYDANGNMLTGLGGKVMTYDGENRPLSVTYAGSKTCYVYGADGKRLKKVDNLATTQNCAAIPATAPATVYFGAVEIRNWKLTGEQVITYPHPSIKLVNGYLPAAATYLHRDHLGSVRAITTPAAAEIESAVYKPFGEQTEWLSPSQTAAETKGWIGERYDADAGLQYLNARYYDPQLGMFIQPDWFEVTRAGVGTNRYSYSANDPINKADAGGNCVWDACVIEGYFAGLAAAAAVGYLAADGIDNGSIDGSLTITTIENFSPGQEGFSADPDAGVPHIVSGPTAEVPQGYVESLDIEVDGGAIVVAGSSPDLFKDRNIVIREKPGPKTDPDAPHNKKIREVGAEIERQGGKILAGGGTSKEAIIKTPGGYKASRRPDILYTDKHGNTRGVNVGRTNADGTPVKREKEAMSDLELNAGIEMDFERYD